MTLPDTWITDWEPSERMPDYTRANAGEVLAGPVSPLGWTLVWEQGCGPGWGQGFVDYGVYRPGELPEHQPGFMGLFGGYLYIGLSHMRIWGIRSGVGYEVIDHAQLGDHPDTPPYRPHPDDECPECGEKIAETTKWILRTTDFPEAMEDRREAEAARDARPDLTRLSDAELVARAREMIPLIEKYFRRHIMSSASAPVGMSIVEGMLGELGRGEQILELISGLGDVDSAAPSDALWELSRMVNRSPELTRLFDHGVDAVAAALPDDPDGFGRAFAGFLHRFGSRGPNEFDIREHSWETKPELALALVDTIRRSPDDQAPELRRERLRESRERLAREVREALPEEKREEFDRALRSASVFIPARERTKTNIITAIHEVRMPIFELGRRAVAAGRLSDLTDITMLLASELDDYVANPDAFRDVIAERLEGYRELWELEPPFIIAGEVKPLGEWKRREQPKAPTARPGDILTGVPGCAGVHTGVARVLQTPDAADELEPGDILVAPATDPAWTPLFLIAGGAVVNVGSRNSHSVIISRELGIPCVVSVTGATDQIPDGSTVTVDGAGGTVTIESVPAATRPEVAPV
jgi:pyruvate,water dikinase